LVEHDFSAVKEVGELFSAGSSPSLGARKWGIFSGRLLFSHREAAVELKPLVNATDSEAFLAAGTVCGKRAGTNDWPADRVPNGAKSQTLAAHG